MPETPTKKPDATPSLKINPAFRDLIPPLTKAQKETLEKNLVQSGCREPLVIWKNQILDGHHRYEICCRKNIPFQTVEETFESETEAKLWMLDNQFGRRDVSDFVKIELALQFEALEKALAKERMNAGKSDPRQHVAQGKVQERIGKRAGVSGEQVRRVKKILASVSEDKLRELRRQETTISEVFNSLKEFNNPYEKVEMWTIDGKLMIRQDFYKILPDLEGMEYEHLKKDILQRGCLDPILVWSNIILDGHQRYKICCEHGIAYKTSDLSDTIKTVIEAKMFIIDHQFGRKNLLEDFEKLDLAFKLEELEKEKDKIAPLASNPKSPIQPDHSCGSLKLPKDKELKQKPGR